ncbi:hypothetical protein AA16373_0478 [Komagataeibacter swingsii DSM 16373]|nr:hypothetical protein AA16373_0478 [Komagataeibacter swingsii DSM 16373]
MPRRQQKPRHGQELRQSHQCERRRAVGQGIALPSHRDGLHATGKGRSRTGDKEGGQPRVVVQGHGGRGRRAPWRGRLNWGGWHDGVTLTALMRNILRLRA